MSMKLDIFHRETADSLIWRGTANDLDDAKLRVRALAAKVPGEYVLVNLASGTRFLLKS
jgi:hypothetical protein